MITPTSKPAAGYSGPAAYNPYAWTNDCPFQAGNVTGYDNWFQAIKIGSIDSDGSTVVYVTDPKFSANLEGGQEALRLVQQYVPGATLVTQTMPCQLPGQPVSYDVQLPDGKLLDGGLLLNTYYHQGYGVTAGSDDLLKADCDVPKTTAWQPPSQTASVTVS